MLKRWQMKHNSLDYHNLFGIFPLLAKFTCSKLDINQKIFFIFKTFRPWEWIVSVFFKHFFSTKCAPFLLKIEEDFNIDG
jgi:hypothetical protein